jgi:opacity protein-like surface antigen
MKRFALVALLAAMLFGLASSASATELKVKGNLDVYGMWSANLRDFDSDNGDADNYMTTQRMRTYFDFLASENLKAVLGLEMEHIWGQGAGGDWGTDGTADIKVKHAYLDFTLPRPRST